MDQILGKPPLEKTRKIKHKFTSDLFTDADVRVGLYSTTIAHQEMVWKYQIPQNSISCWPSVHLWSNLSHITWGNFRYFHAKHLSSVPVISEIKY